VAVLLFAACAETAEIKFDAPSKNLKNKILTDKDSSMIIGKTNTITMVNNSLYISDIYEGYSYTKYDTKTREAYRFGKRGQDPGEVLLLTKTEWHY
jgi:hypothetical protein